MSVPDEMVYQCKVCENWQVGYSMQAMLDAFAEFTVDNGQFTPNLSPVHEAIEDVVREHTDTHLSAARRTAPARG